MATSPDLSPLRKECSECFYLRKDGTKGDDLIHNEILDNPEVDIHFRTSVLRSAIEGGMTPEQAQRFYG